MTRPKRSASKVESTHVTVMFGGFQWTIAYDAERDIAIINRSAIYAIAPGQECFPVAAADWSGETFVVRKWFPVRGYRWRKGRRARDLEVLAECLSAELMEQQG